MLNIYRIFLMSVLLSPFMVMADGVVNFVSAEQNIASMDTDKNGFVDVIEMRAYLEKSHGAGYKKAELDFLESTAKGKSCGTAFAQKLYN